MSTSGDLYALIVLGVFAITAHATLQGVLAPLRLSLAAVELPIDAGVLLLGAHHERASGVLRLHPVVVGLREEVAITGCWVTFVANLNSAERIANSPLGR